jgi:hypothetical protein
MSFKYFVHTNNKQILGALVAKYTVEKYTRHGDRFTVEILNSDEVPELINMTGKSYLRNGKTTPWRPNDLQSFTLTRFMPPEAMNYSGKSIVVDADVFSVGTDVWDLFQMDMGTNAVLAKKHKEDSWATSVMLLDNTKLRHWTISDITSGLVEKKYDYADIMGLKDKSHMTRGITLGLLDENWNCYDTLTPDTKLLHNTYRATQPWKTGLKRDFQVFKMKPILGVIPREWIHTLLGRGNRHYRKHPDPNQETFFFSHLKSAIINGAISEKLVHEQIALTNIRHDALNVLDRVKSI